VRKEALVARPDGTAGAGVMAGSDERSEDPVMSHSWIDGRQRMIGRS
jgi:hypothetical protein